jgi:hypothetical protein
MEAIAGGVGAARMSTTLKAAVESYLRAKTMSRSTRNEYFSTLRKWERWGDSPPIEELQQFQGFLLELLSVEGVAFGRPIGCFDRCPEEPTNHPHLILSNPPQQDDGAVIGLLHVLAGRLVGSASILVGSASIMPALKSTRQT